ncbi:DUF1579 domain-containing protein [bacterium]|nr:DUF1579 domain-containing protein [bacterium]
MSFSPELPVAISQGTIAIGYDPKKNEMVGTWIDSVTPEPVGRRGQLVE